MDLDKILTIDMYRKYLNSLHIDETAGYSTRSMCCGLAQYVNHIILKDDPIECVTFNGDSCYQHYKIKRSTYSTIPDWASDFISKFDLAVYPGMSVSRDTAIDILNQVEKAQQTCTTS